MIRYMRNTALVVLLTIAFPGGACALDSGLFRTVPVDTPDKGTVWVSNTSFYSPIAANTVLKNYYGVTESHVISSLTHVSLGVTDRIALTGTVPYFADMFKQGDLRGEKTGAGDVSLGLRMSFRPNKLFLDRFSFGANASIPERMGYGSEPLGFRTFSTGEFSYSAEMAFGFDFRLFEGYLSTVYHQFPNAPTDIAANTSDMFYESALGYLGIGMPDTGGLTEVIYQDHLIVTTGFAVPLKTWFSGIVEAGTASFTRGPTRDTIIRLAPGFRLGRPERIHLNAGVDFRLEGEIPVRTYMLQVTVPFLRPARLIKPPVDERKVPKNLVRSRNSLVAVRNFTSSDYTFLYEDELKHSFRKRLSSLGIMDLVREDRTDKSFARMKLLPGEDPPERIGVRLGANYLITTNIAEYAIERGSSFNVPFLFSKPNTTFSLSARASVTDLVSGRIRDLGIISASVKRSRGFNLFPQGESSDLVHLSEPERRIHEKELIDQWVERFNEIILDNLDVFGWEPKRTEMRGDEEVKG